jgi:DNA-binding MarR family transcriptional regulator
MEETMNAKIDTKTVNQIITSFEEMMKMIGQASDGEMVRLIHRVELTLPQMISLQMLKQGPQTVSSLSAELRLTPGAVSRLVDHLVQKKIVSREEGDPDRRRKTLSLTAAGKRLFGQFESIRAVDFTKVMSQLDPALSEDLKDILGRVVEVLRSRAQVKSESGSRDQLQAEKTPGGSKR